MIGRPSTDVPLISVLICVRDGEAYLSEAIDSALSQSYRPIEIIVVDDGSRDGTPEIAERYRGITYVRQEPLGISTARNRAVDASSGELLAFLDADDVFTPDRLRRMTRPLAADSMLEAVFGCVSEFVQPGLPEPSVSMLRAPRDRAPSRLITAMMIRRSAFDRIGPFDVDQHVNVTVEWSSRAADAGLRSVMLDDVVLRRRLHGENHGVAGWDAGRQLLRIARSSIERRRTLGRRSGNGETRT